jgi:hypothetical protein
VNAVQSARTGALQNGIAHETPITELTEGDQPVLIFGRPGDRPIDFPSMGLRPAFSACMRPIEQQLSRHLLHRRERLTYGDARVVRGMCQFCVDF